MKKTDDSCGHSPSFDIHYPRHSDRAGFFVLSMLVDCPNGGWMWEHVQIKIDHVYKIDFHEGPDYAGQTFRHAIDIRPKDGESFPPRNTGDCLPKDERKPERVTPVPEP